MDLAIVIPVYNEEESIQVLLEDICKLLANEGITYTLFVINDGSTDGSLQKLTFLTKHVNRLQVITQRNSGHGASLIKGYGLALAHQWVFQFDSDYQYSLAAFNDLWKHKDNYDLLLAERKQRHASLPRKGITLVLKALVRLLYGNGVEDINVPYRLIRTTQLQLALKYINPASFAPNMLITAYSLKKKLPIYTTVSVLRLGGSIKQSKVTASIFKGSLRSILDLVTFRFKL